MPIYDPDHIEYAINTGHVQIVLDDGGNLPAYFAHPTIGRKFPGVAIIHDWWGLNELVVRVANIFAQMGHYVMVPDLFDGKTATTPQQAIQLVETLQDNGYPRVHTALGALETHHQCNSSVAAIGIGMGGSLAFEAAIVRDDLEAAVAYGGFPQRYFGQFERANTPIYALYGEHEPHISKSAINRLKKELAATALKESHLVEVVPGMGHDFFSLRFDDTQKEISRQVIRSTMGFLDKFLEYSKQPPRRIF